MSVKSSDDTKLGPAVMSDGAVRLSIGRITLQSGQALDDAVLVVKTFGALNQNRDNAVVMPTSFGASHADFEWMVGPESVFDPERYFVVIVNLFGNGLSTSPSTHPDFADQNLFPVVTAFDNALVIRFVLDRVFGVAKINMAIGWSMGGQVAYHLAALFPDDVERLVPICASARTAAHNKVFLEGARSVLTTDANYDPQSGWFAEPPKRALPALGRFYAGWALSQEFYREECWKDLGYASVEDFLCNYWEAGFRHKDANNLLCHISTWKKADISANSLYRNDLTSALAAIRARVLLLPCAHDLYFRVADTQAELNVLKSARMEPLQSVWGHRAGNPIFDPPSKQFITSQVQAFLLQE